jgi:Uma2 family endonuclease
LEKQTEIVDGKVEIKKPSGLRASGIATRIAVKLGIYLKTNNIGRLYGADATFTTVNENERMADVALVFNVKLQEGEPISKASFAPDLAVEVISPTDMNSKVVKKVREYFAAGVRRVWLVEPEHETVTVYLSLNQTRIFYKNEDMIDEEILPNFRLPLKDIFLA